MACIEEIAKDEKSNKIEDQLLVFIRRQVETKETVCLLRRGQKHNLYKMTHLQMMVNESHLSIREKHTFISKMNLGTLGASPSRDVQLP
nr:hypothetical protein [Tanacetum cinerariifolium]